MPVLSGVIQKSLPIEWQLPRVLYLVYEVLFLVVLVVFNMRNSLSSVRKLSLYVGLYYAFWVLADIVILAWNWDVGFAIRVIPNLLYYSGFMIVVSSKSLNREHAVV